MSESAVKKVATVREAVGAFVEPDRLQEAASELQSSGFNHADVSMLASGKALRDKIGIPAGGPLATGDDPNAPHQAYRSPPDVGNAKGVLIGAPMYVAATVTAGVIAATGGTVALLLGGTVLAGSAGGLAGYVFANKMERKLAQDLMQALDEGGLLLWARTTDPDHEKRATEILRKHGATHVHVHELKAPQRDRAPLPKLLEVAKLERL